MLAPNRLKGKDRLWRGEWDDEFSGVLDLPSGHFFEGSFVAFENFLALGVRQPRLHIIIPHEEMDEIFEANPGCWEMNLW